jgi:hypothetical protein
MHTDRQDTINKKLETRNLKLFGEL